MLRVCRTARFRTRYDIFRTHALTAQPGLLSCGRCYSNCNHALVSTRFPSVTRKGLPAAVWGLSGGVECCGFTSYRETCGCCGLQTYRHKIIFGINDLQISCTREAVNDKRAPLKRKTTVRGHDRKQQGPMLSDRERDCWWRVLRILPVFKGNNLELLCAVFFCSFSDQKQQVS